MQEVVIGGWTAGKGERQIHIRCPSGGPAGRRGGRRLDYVGKVGTGFSDGARRTLLATLRPAGAQDQPVCRGPACPGVEALATWVRPVTVGEVRFTEWTTDGLFRHPVWRGIRPDKSAEEVRRES